MAQRVGRGIALLFQGRGTRRGWVVSSTPRLYFTSWKDPVPIVQEAGWTPGLVWTSRKSRPTGIRSPYRSARSQLLYQLSYPAHTQWCCASYFTTKYLGWLPPLPCIHWSSAGLNSAVSSSSSDVLLYTEVWSPDLICRLFLLCKNICFDTFHPRSTYKLGDNCKLHHPLCRRSEYKMGTAINPYPTAFPYGNGMVLHFYQQQESSMTKIVHKVINRGLKAYV